jgi:hypothetical protein
MREDMAKVIVERPRHGGGVRFPRSSVAVRDELPMEDAWKRQSIRRPWTATSCYKGLNENLAPLRRYLRANLGRPWNKVYSEVCQRINRNSAVQMHVWQHLMLEVCTDPHIVRGDVGQGPWSFRWFGFYVDAKTGLLRENLDHWRWHQRGAKPAKAIDRVAIDDRHEHRLIDGLWYELELAPLPRGARAVYDMVLRRWCHVSDLKAIQALYDGRRVYAARKRQLNKREIRKLPCVAAARSTSR